MEYRFEHPSKACGYHLYELAKETKSLYVNSIYYYFWMSDYFKFSSGICIYSKTNEIIGFSLGFLKPEQVSTLFIWQIGVNINFRNKGVAKGLLQFLFNSNISLNYIEATIGFMNTPSILLFESISKIYNANLKTETFLNMESFPLRDHEAEILFRIGPIAR